jgi:hypothetical protein
METKIQGYNFDGDPDGLKFVQFLDRDEFETMRSRVDDRGEANLLDSRNNYHFEITKSADGIYMVSKVQPSSSSSWF